MLQAINASGATPMVRVPWLSAGDIMKALDAGAYVAGVHAAGPDGFSAERTMGFAVPYPPDYADITANTGALQSIAAVLRGDIPPNPDEGWSAFRAIHRDRDSGSQAHFKLLNPQPRVDDILETVGFKRFLEVALDLETAVASF